MARLLTKQQDEIGQSPDALKFRGIKKTEEITIQLFDYNSEEQTELSLGNIDEALPFRNKKSTTWININGLHDEQLMQKLVTDFNINPLILSDVMNTNNTSRFADFEDCLFISLKKLNYDDKKSSISAEQYSLVITPHFLFTFCEKPDNTFDAVRERIRKQNKRIVNSGTDYLAFALLDILIDNYILILSNFGIKIESIEDRSLVRNPDKNIPININALKKELIYFRKHIKPAREIIILFSQMESDLIAQGTYVHLRDLVNNINHVSDSLDSYREILSDQLNIYHMTVNSRLNDIMKVLTIFSVIFIPLTFLVGVYGMNFDYFPELHYKYSYMILWGIMVSLVGIMLYLFRKKHWI